MNKIEIQFIYASDSLHSVQILINGEEHGPFEFMGLIVYSNPNVF